MLIDVHGHIGTTGTRRIAPEHLVLYLQEAHVDRLLVANRDAGESLDETDANVLTLEFCRENPRLAPLYWIRAGRPDHAVTAMAGAFESEPFVGAVLAPAHNRFTLSEELLGPELRFLAERRKPVLTLTSRTKGARPADVYELATRFPQVAFILARAQPDAAWIECVDAVRRAAEREDARLYLSTAHASHEEIVYAVQALTAERLLFGSDAPCLEAEHGGRTVQLLSELRQSLSPRDYARLTGENAYELFFNGQSN